jgi:hypothetical protein|tara:strand:+ start:71 stop:376 length:306 start_codon:yes stop_codon:yes gene_type:complete
MVQKTKGARVYKTMQGKQIDMDLLRKRNELTPAVGNVRMNARGDELGPGGKVVRNREEILKDYYESSAGVPDELAVKKAIKKDLTDDWVEDDDGNFIPKGE